MRFALLAAVVAVTLSGCGGDVPRGRVHGTIKLGGKPLTGATVVFIAKDNKTHVLALKPDGSYEVTGVALGPIKVAVQAEPPRSPAKSEFGPAKGAIEEKDSKVAKPAAESKAAGSTVPAHYANADTSGLTFELTSVDQEWSIDLK